MRALERGLDVLAAVQARRGAGLHELHVALGLSKATLLRLLRTLIGRQLVWQRLADGAYLPHAQPALSAPEADRARIAELASPLMKALSERVAWPSVLAVPRLDHMEIVETNSPLFRLDAATLGPVGVKLSMIHTATGRAYLAACAEPERDAIIARLRPPAASDASEAELRAIIAAARVRGYSVREPVHPWPDRSRQLVLRDGRRSMGMAITVGGAPVAAINLTWPARRAIDDRVIARHRTALAQTARAIGQRLEETAESFIR